MSSSRRSNNGRSPLVRKQSQITAFFSQGKSPPADAAATSSPDPTPPPASHKKKPPLVVGSTPSSLRSKEPGVSQGKDVARGGTGNPSSTSPGSQRKPPLVIGVTPPVPASKKPKTPSSGLAEKKGCLYSSEVVGRRIKVYWSIDKRWYEGHVRSFDSESGKHAVQYDDGEEEVLDLAKERTKWIVDEETPQSFRRLRRRISLSSEADVNDAGQDTSGGDSTEDEDWGKKMEKEVEDDDSEEVELEEENEDGDKSLKRSLKLSKKQENGSIGKNRSIKKPRMSGNCVSVSEKMPPLTAEKAISPSHMDERPVHHACADHLASDAAERFRNREMEKFHFLHKGRRDAKRKQPGDIDYDPKTLYLPQDFLKSLSGGQRQWWEFKAKHMDKVLFFKMGKFYEMFEMDAHVGAKELDLQYMKGDQPHCGFPERNFSMNLEKLARKGFRVLVIEQTETPDQLELRRKEMGSKDKVVKREICAVVTKGTLTEGELLSTNPDASYLLSLTENCTSEKGISIGVCVVDAATSKFMLGQFKDNLERQCLCSLLSELRPVEIIRPSKVLSPETDAMLQKHTRSPLVNDLIPISEFWDADRTISEINCIFDLPRHPKKTDSVIDGISSTLVNNGENTMHLPAVLAELIAAGESGTHAISAFGGCLFYLRQALLDETLLKCAKFEPLLCSDSLNNFQKSYMVLDAAALDNLEILENDRDGGQSGTLLAQLDHCVTAFGKRLLKSWLVRPLYDANLIVERQDAIAGLKGSSLASALEFRKDLSKLPDMERLLARVFGSCEANGRNANRVILYEDASKKQLKEFIAALRGCQLMSQACLSLSAILDNSKSSRLHHLLTPGKGLPDMFSTLKHFREAFDWSEAEKSGRIIPHGGGDAEYDSACKTVKDVEHSLTVYLREQHKALGDSSTKYVTVGKDSYLLEVAEHLRSKVPRDYELHSSKKGFFRYWTPKIKKWLLELSQAETERESKLKSIMQRLIGHFSEHYHKWRKLVSATAELDVLISLAIATDYYDGPTCRPHIKANASSNEVTPSLYAKCLGHPLLSSDALGKGPFVPNDVNLGGANHPSFILLTGPNMGGKSTLLRQVCLAVILAQIGADVPAESFELSPVDRVFVRMGAKDHIMAGQSTFLTELSETASMLSSATCRSLVALDELGRGTSTSDGQAIAESVLEYFVFNVQCRGMFSTHYHRLAIDYAKNSKVLLCHMACQVGEGSEAEEVTFLYRLTPGSCPKSYGVNVARLAGLPLSVLQKASIKSLEFEAAYGKCRNALGSTLLCPRDRETALFSDVLHLASETDSNEKAVTLNLLSEVQQNVRLLMQES